MWVLRFLDAWTRLARSFGRFLLLPLILGALLLSIRFSKPDMNRTKNQVSRVARLLVKLLGVRIGVQGTSCNPEGLVVANHRSYIDVLVLLALFPCAFLAKSEIRRWPLFGAVAQRIGSVFVDRSSKESRQRVRRQIVDRVLVGQRVVTFPEGTTSAGPGVRPFHRGLFHEAAERRVGMTPVAIEYADAADAWINDDDFVSHFLRRFGKPHTYVAVRIGAQIPPTTDGADSCIRAQRWIEAALVDLKDAVSSERIDSVGGSSPASSTSAAPT